MGWTFFRGDMDGITLYVVLVIFVASLIRSALGFGEALVAVPLLALRVPVSIATPLAVLVSITIASVIVVQDRRHVHFRSAGWLIGATVLGIPLGLALLRYGNEREVKVALAAVIILFSIYALLVRRAPELHSDSRAWLLGCGFCAGVLGGAYGMNGPPLAIYGGMKRWAPPRFRATLQAYFLPASVIGMTGYWIAGLWVREVTRFYLWALPFVVVAILVGRAINRRIGGETFLKYVYAGLMVTGALLMAQAVR